MSELARLETRRQGALVCATVEGEIDMSNAASLEGGLREALADGDGLVLDLTAVTFLDSAGVRLLDHLVAACEPETGLRVVTAPDGPVPFTLRLCGFRPDLLAATVDDAFAALGRD